MKLNEKKIKKSGKHELENTTLRCTEIKQKHENNKEKQKIEEAIMTRDPKEKTKQQKRKRKKERKEKSEKTNNTKKEEKNGREKNYQRQK